LSPGQGPAQFPRSQGGRPGAAGSAITDAPKRTKAMGGDFSRAFLTLKRREWDSCRAHFTAWEHDTTLDI
jgi:glutamine synthetase